VQYPVVGNLVRPPTGLVFSKEELAKHDGKQPVPEGYADAPIYIAIRGKVRPLEGGLKWLWWGVVVVVVVCGGGLPERLHLYCYCAGAVNLSVVRGACCSGCVPFPPTICGDEGREGWRRWCDEVLVWRAAGVRRVVRGQGLLRATRALQVPRGQGRLQGPGQGEHVEMQKSPWASRSAGSYMGSPIPVLQRLRRRALDVVMMQTRMVA
jgi:hypothetical protein